MRNAHSRRAHKQRLLSVAAAASSSTAFSNACGISLTRLAFKLTVKQRSHPIECQFLFEPKFFIITFRGEARRGKDDDVRRTNISLAEKRGRAESVTVA